MSELEKLKEKLRKGKETKQTLNHSLTLGLGLPRIQRAIDIRNIVKDEIRGRLVDHFANLPVGVDKPVSVLKNKPKIKLKSPCYIM